jgi:flavin reductase (DIM6/NTAB) family NADH-FMN oxidoreductase RutF
MIALARLGALPKGEAAEADGAGFGDAMRQIARGICLVTYGTGDEGAGVTATSVSTLSADPPTLIVCVDRSASIYQSLARAAPFGVSVLSASQREFADRFSGGADLKGERLRGARGELCRRASAYSGTRQRRSNAKSRTSSTVMPTRS